MNLNNTTALDSAPPLSQRIFVSLFYGIISTVGLCFQTLVFVSFLGTALVRKGEQSRTGVGSNKRITPFHILILHLQICEMATYLLYLLYASPCVAMAGQVYGPVIGAVCGNAEAVIFIGTALATLIVSINRSLNIDRANTIARKLFTVRNSMALSALCWLVSILFVIIDTVIFYNPVRFLEKQFYFAVVPESTNSSATNISSIFIYAVVFGTIVFYGYALFKICQLRKNVASENEGMQARMGRHERRMFYQAVCIWVSLVVNIILFRVIPKFLTGLSAVLVSGIVIMSQTSSTPVCMLVFSADVRQSAKGIISTLIKPACIGDRNAVGPTLDLNTIQPSQHTPAPLPPVQ